MVRAAEAWGGPCFRAPPHRAGGTEPGASGGPRASSARVRPLASAVGQGLPPPARPPWTAGRFHRDALHQHLSPGPCQGGQQLCPLTSTRPGLSPLAAGGPPLASGALYRMGGPHLTVCLLLPPPRGAPGSWGAGHGSHTRTVFCSLGPPAAGKATPPPGWPAQNQQTPRLVTQPGGLALIFPACGGGALLPGPR